MAGAEWVSWVAAAMFAALSLFYVVRLVASARSVDVSRAVTSLGMVAMLVPWLDPLPRLAWQVLFGLGAAHVAARLLKRSVVEPVSHRESHGDRHHEIHLVIGALTMIYMFAVMPAGHSMEPGEPMGPSDLAIPLLNWAFVAYFVVFVVRLGARLAAPATEVEATSPRDLVLSPHLLGSSEVVMGIGMSYMLITRP
jgi:Domain of unknown function (DUF5134)